MMIDSCKILMSVFFFTPYSYHCKEFIQRYHVLAPGKELESTCSSSRCILIIDESMPMMMESFSKDEG